MPHRLLTTDARRLLDCTPGLVYVYDLDEHRDVYANPALAALLGASPDAAGAMGDRVFDALLHPDDAAAVAAHHARLAATADDRVLEVEFRLRDRGGQWVFVHCRERVFTRDADGRAKQIIGVAEDVSERRRSEAALRASEALLQETARLAKVGGWAIDLAAQTLTWTEEVYRIHEVDDPSFRPTIATAIDFYAPESRPVISAAVDRALACAEPFDLELEIVTAKGSRQPCSVDRFPAGSRGLGPRVEEVGRDVAEGILCRLTALPGRFGGPDGAATRPDRVWSAYPPSSKCKRPSASPPQNGLDVGRSTA
jgi:PAS domain S-box-containing protein